MGSSESRLGSRPPRTPRAHRFKRALSSFFLCAGSASLPPLQTVDDPAELLIISAEHSDLVVNNRPSKESAVTCTAGTAFSPKTASGASSRCSKTASESSSSEGGLDKVETRNQEEGLSESNELFPPYQLNADYRYGDSASTSYGNQLSSDPVSASDRANGDVLSGDNMMNINNSRICSEVGSSSRSSLFESGGSLSDRTHVENYMSRVETTNDTDLSPLSDSSVTSHSAGNGLHWDTAPSSLGFVVSDRERVDRDENMLNLDVVSISSDILSNSTAELSGSREARRNSRRQFWDAFSRQSSRRHSDSRVFHFPTDDVDDLGSQDRWLLDFGGDLFEDRVEGDSGHLGSRGSRTHGTSQRRLESRTEFWDRLRGGLDTRDGRTSICPSGLHLDGSCSCESILMAEESSTRSSISRIVMLAEALFEVLDDIHQQPVPLSLSMVSLPAPESIVDSFPVKNYGKEDASENGEGVAQCYICLAEYEEADKIRLLPCHHEFHLSCIDKWLKEIQGVCPLCRRDVREGFVEDSFSNSEIHSL